MIQASLYDCLREAPVTKRCRPPLAFRCRNGLTGRGSAVGWVVTASFGACLLASFGALPSAYGVPFSRLGRPTYGLVPPPTAGRTGELLASVGWRVRGPDAPMKAF